MKLSEFESLPAGLKGGDATLGIVLGSGLGGAVETMEVEFEIPYDQVAGLPVSRVPGHAGRLLKGKIGDVPVVVAQGRVHLYEGWSAKEVTALVRLFHAVGVRRLLLTNAAGLLCPDF